MFIYEGLDAAAWERVRFALERSNEDALKVIHDEYNVSAHDYCCDLSPLKLHFRNALEKYDRNRRNATNCSGEV